MSTKATLSIVTPNHNDGPYIEKYVDSIFDQDYKDIQLIIVDDGSTDNSKKVLKKLQQKYKAKNFTVIYLPKNKGACYARNHGAKLATGKYISFLPADSRLFPGMARLWVENLEKYPEYDFLYGGYKFVNENYEEVYSFLGDEFDPYFLEVTNYIDGSFPLKKTLYDKMGGWDESVKSLQDWDFWLTAVKTHGAKGLYIRDVFFDTIQPHAGGLSFDSHQNWLARTDYIKKKHGITSKEICVTGTGARFHARNIAKMLGADYKDFPAHKKHKYKMIYIVGFFGNVREAFFGTSAMRVVHWIGSDILALKNTPEKERAYIINWIKNNIDVNLVEFEQTRKELAEYGLTSRICPLPPKQFYAETPLPKKFTVAVYDPAINKQLYHSDLIHEIAKEMKDVDFKFFGDYQNMGTKDNIQHLGKVDNIESLIRDTSCLLRITMHDGLPISFLEFMSAGRNVVTNVEFPNTVQVKTVTKEAIKKALKEAKKLSLNKKGASYVRTLADHTKFKEFIYGLMQYDPKKYWDSRADLWNRLEGQQHDAKEEYILEHELDALKAKSVIDIGCGNGRLAPILSKNKKYLGIDISKSLIDAAKKAHPKLEFKVADIRNIASLNTEFDVAFSYTSLLHIPPEQLADAFTQIKAITDTIILVEPTKEIDTSGVTERNLHPEVIKEYEKGAVIYGIKSSFTHDYLQFLDVKKLVDMGGRQLIIGKIR